jgi:hypothetical protein
MRRNSTRNTAFAAASLLIFGVTASALADEKLDPAGTWALRASRPGRPAMESTLKLERNADQLVGVITDAQGRTGTIKDAQIKGNDISFTVEAERDGQKFYFMYKGKLTKETMKGTVVAKILGRDLTLDFDGKRAKENVTFTGSWKLSLGPGGGQRAQQGGGARPQGPGGRGGRQGGGRGMPQMMLNLREEGGRVSGDFIGFAGKATPIQDAKLKDGELSFKVPQELGPNKITMEFTGKLAGDKLQGTAKIPLPQGTRSLNFQGERTKTATANAAGTWKLKVALKDGPTFEPTLKLTQSGTTLKGAYIGEQGETQISNALIFGEEITFDVNREREGKKYRLHYQGKVKGDALSGSVDYDFDGIVGYVEFKGDRVSASTASSEKTH